jgi:hypothetical protein
MRSQRALRLLALGFFVTALIGLTYNQAGATPITFGFQGNVISVTSSLGGTFNTTQTISGSYTFESTTPNVFAPDPNFGAYSGALTALSFAVNGYTATLGSGGTNNIIVLNDLGQDRYQVNNGPFSGSSVNGFSPNFFALDLIDPTQTAFSTNLLPLVPPNLALFSTTPPSRQITLSFIDTAGTNAFVIANLNSLTAVPEPSVLLLMVTGLVGLLTVIKGKKVN